jgi:hypothetical protein
MSNDEAGRAAFERIRAEIVSGIAHWVARPVDPGPYRLRATRQPGGDDEDEDEDVLRI